MTSYPKEKHVRNALLFALVACLASLASPTNAQYLVPPGFYGYGWGEHPYWLDPTFDYAYELKQTRDYDKVICLNEERPIYSHRAPYRFLGVKGDYVCRPDTVLMNR